LKAEDHRAAGQSGADRRGKEGEEPRADLGAFPSQTITLDDPQRRHSMKKLYRLYRI
jgi:hypothetical protein